MKEYYIGIDLGGTFIKGGIITRDGKMIVKDSIPTEAHSGADNVVANIGKLCNILLEKSNLNKENVVGIGLGAPGMIDSQNGLVVVSGNFKWKNMPIAKKLENIMNLPVKIANDANVAALGEATFGAGMRYKDSVMVTLGTGVGGGIIIDKHIFEGNKGGGAEIGHMIIKADGEHCTCGFNGCFEAYSSATALIRDTKRAMESNKNSLMWQVGIDNVDGKTAFDYADLGDESAKMVVENYLKMLSIGLINLANIFRPEAIIIGGGVSHQKGIDKLLYERVNKQKFGGETGPEVKIEVASLKNDAGTYGAAALWF